MIRRAIAGPLSLSRLVVLGIVRSLEHNLDGCRRAAIVFALSGGNRHVRHALVGFKVLHERRYLVQIRAEAGDRGRVAHHTQRGEVTHVHDLLLQQVEHGVAIGQVLLFRSQAGHHIAIVLRVQFGVIGVFSRECIEPRLRSGHVVAARHAACQGIDHGELREYADEHERDNEQRQLHHQIAARFLGIDEVDRCLGGIDRRLAPLERSQRHILF